MFAINTVAFKMRFVAVAVLLHFPLIFGVPADLSCLGTRQNGQIHYKLLPDITGEIHDCDTQWLVNGKVTALNEGNGKTVFDLPILNATANTAIMVPSWSHQDSEKLEFILICPHIKVHKRLLCAYSAPDYTATHDPLLRNKEFAEDSADGGFPNWGIVLTVIAGIVLSGIIIYVYAKVRRSSGYYLADEEKPV